LALVEDVLAFPSKPHNRAYGSGSCQFNLQVLDVQGWTFHIKTCDSKALSTSTPPSSLWTGGALLTLSR
jgi:hypothetical protein